MKMQFANPTDSNNLLAILAFRKIAIRDARFALPSKQSMRRRVCQSWLRWRGVGDLRIQVGHVFRIILEKPRLIRFSLLRIFLFFRNVRMYPRDEQNFMHVVVSLAGKRAAGINMFARFGGVGEQRDFRRRILR